MRPSQMLELQKKLAAPQHLRPISRDRVPFQKGFPAWIPETNTLLWGINWVVLVETIKEHAKKNGFTIDDLPRYVDEAVCAGLPKAGRGILGFCVKKQQPNKEEKVTYTYYNDPRGPKNLSGNPRGRSPKDWKALTLCCLDGRLNPEFIRNFTSRIGCGSCKQGWMKALRENPPDYSTADAQFSWANRIHNFVNKKLGKPQVSLEQAREIWK